ncbi:vasoactive intestinal polypeptide receptor isoform X2 [Oncorhynchus keta]|uniref:vasoactive intestinal polypeptide receptor isoform X2 n=1 Tax=Oncorhynchus keta TaxID=8018 RepID=UPI00227D2448|nr:vasoactive intestinal polypeptide receptor isoform X2 [Oncorhynchus keta]
MDVSKGVLVFTLVCTLRPMLSIQICDIMLEMDKERETCMAQLENMTTGCSGTWDKVACWPSANTGQVVTIPCPVYFLYLTNDFIMGNLSKTCTSDGWSEVTPASYALNCGYNANVTKVDDDDKEEFYWAVKVGYTIGHSLSLISLTIAIVLLCTFRKLHCTRNYIHMNLFVAFILKAIAVFIKDVVLYEVGESDCQPETVGCKAGVVFFQYGIMTSYFWLLVEGLYVHTLLAVSFFSERKYFWWYILIGWGAPTVFITAWVITKAYLKHSGCWDIINDHPWWIIKMPILLTILVNFILFICIIRILRQKMNCRDIGRKESHQYSRLAKSTLLLIPLFGINYIIFAFIPEDINTRIRMVIDLILGSFQIWRNEVLLTSKDSTGSAGMLTHTTEQPTFNKNSRLKGFRESKKREVEGSHRKGKKDRSEQNGGSDRQNTDRD